MREEGARAGHHFASAFPADALKLHQLEHFGRLGNNRKLLNSGCYTSDIVWQCFKYLHIGEPLAALFRKTGSTTVSVFSMLSIAAIS